jgi:hypothetical protein
MSITIKEIPASECLSTSVNTLNINFLALEQETCELQKFIKKQVRTFFFYGPNSQTDSESNMDPGGVTRPSNEVITNFVNSPNELNLPILTRKGDIAYIIYQKTGYKNNLYLNVPTGTDVQTVANQTAATAARQAYTIEIARIRAQIAAAPNRGERIRLYNQLLLAENRRVANANANAQISQDIVSNFAVIFFIWRLTYSGNGYSVDDGFPKFTQATTSQNGEQTAIPWNDPRLWTQF